MSADVSARLAWPDDAAAIARIQAAVWAETYADLLGQDELADFPVDEVAQRWSQGLQSPGDARRRVLVAVEGPTVRGFAVTQPSPDPDADPIADAEISEFSIAPEHRGAGHGSRLLHACVDTVRADAFTHARWWLPTQADGLRGWMAASGWATDGAHRELEAPGGARLKQIRLHVSLADDT